MGLPTTTRLIELARATGTNNDPLIRQQLATIIANERVARYTNLRAMAKIAVGQLPGPEMSLAKLSLTANMVRTYELLSSVLGPALVADNGGWGTYAWTQYLLGGTGHAGGRRFRRGHAQHHRRAGPRTAEGAGTQVAGTQVAGTRAGTAGRAPGWPHRKARSST